MVGGGRSLLGGRHRGWQDSCCGLLVKAKLKNLMILWGEGGILRYLNTDLERPRAVDIFFSLCWQLHKFHHAESLLRAVGVIHHGGALGDKVFKANFLKLQFLWRRRLLS